MKRVLVAVAALTTVAAALPAAAQPWGGDRSPRGGQSQQLEWRIERMAERGALSLREARSLRAQVDAVQQLEWRYRRNGLSDWERRDLDRRFNVIEARIRYEARDGDRRGGDRRGGDRYGYGYGYGDGYRR